jgi:hypothetical protein
MSDLLTTMISLTSAASTSASTARTALIWPSGSGSEPSTTCSSRSASATSSSVERKASISSCGKVPDEADRVGEGELAPVRRLARRVVGVQRREQLVLDQDAGAGQPVEQRRLAGIGVAAMATLGTWLRLAGVALGVRDASSCRESPGAACAMRS